VCRICGSGLGHLVGGALLVGATYDPLGRRPQLQVVGTDQAGTEGGLATTSA
jgi:hypothetical protein